MWKHSELRLQQGLDFTFANASTTCKRKNNTFNFFNYLIYVINIFFLFFFNSHSHQKKKMCSWPTMVTMKELTGQTNLLCNVNTAKYYS